MLVPNRVFSMFRVAARGMEAQRQELGAATENIANANTTRTADGTPYQVKRVLHESEGVGMTRFSRVLSEMNGRLQQTDSRHLEGTSLSRRIKDTNVGPTSELTEVQQERLEYDPTHPDADNEGYVHYPDINVVEEMIRMISANRIYEANLTAVQAAKEMIKRTLEI